MSGGRGGEREGGGRGEGGLGGGGGESLWDCGEAEGRSVYGD